MVRVPGTVDVVPGGFTVPPHVPKSRLASAAVTFFWTPWDAQPAIADASRTTPRSRRALRFVAILSSSCSTWRSTASHGRALFRNGSVARGHREVDSLLPKLLPDMLEPLVFRERDRAGIALALQLARWVLDVRLHQPLDGLADRHYRPGPLGEVVHEPVVALLRILPEVEALRHGGDVFARPLPSEVGVHGEAAGRLAVVSPPGEQRPRGGGPPPAPGRAPS